MKNAWNVMYCTCIKTSKEEEVPGCVVHCEPRKDKWRKGRSNWFRNCVNNTWCGEGGGGGEGGILSICVFLF